MKNITMIAAIGKNNELVKDNQLIWPIKEDLKFFKEQTINKPIVMGINTFNSLPGILPQRKHFVLTSRNLDLAKEVVICHSIEDILKQTEEFEEVMIIGGASIYRQFLDYANKLVLTEIAAEEKDADAYFPDFNHDEWNCEILSNNIENNIHYKHVIYTRKKIQK